MRAYTDAVAQALLQAEKLPVQRMRSAVVCVPYALEGVVRRELLAAGAVLGEVRHGDVVEVAFDVAEDAAAAVRQRVDDAARGAAEWVDV